eukprot:8686295-Pyramimonas_sp.AAC.1
MARLSVAPVPQPTIKDALRGAESAYPAPRARPQKHSRAQNIQETKKSSALATPIVKEKPARGAPAVDQVP